MVQIQPHKRIILNQKAVNKLHYLYTQKHKIDKMTIYSQKWSNQTHPSFLHRFIEKKEHGYTCTFK